MMEGLLKHLLVGGIAVSAVALLCVALLPVLSKRYTHQSMYIICMIVLIGFWIPLVIIPFSFSVEVRTPVWLGRTVNGMRGVIQEKATLPVAEKEVVGVMQSQGLQNESRTEQRDVQGEGEQDHQERGVADAQSTSVAAAEETKITYTMGTSTATVSGERDAFITKTTGLTGWQILSVIWLIGASVVLLVQGWRHFLFARTIRRWKRPLRGSVYESLLLDAKQACKVRTPMKIFICPSISSPMLTGIFRPAILLPDEGLAPEELSLVLRHELIHYRRGDLWAKGFSLLTTALCWFNPVVWLAARITAFYQEVSCDEAVTRSADMEEKRFYSETIIRVIRRQTYPRTVFSTSFYGGKNGMKRRILAIMHEGRRQGGAFICALTLLVTVAGGMAFSPADASVTNEEVQDAWAGKTAYISCPTVDGSRLLSVPSVNDWEIPLGVYLNGTQVYVLESRESSALPEWSHTEGNANWANVCIGGDGLDVGISGWMPIAHLAFIKGEAPSLTGVVQATSVTGYVNIHTRNEEESGLVTMAMNEQPVQVMGYLDNWLHIYIDGQTGFVRTEEVQWAAETEAVLESFMPYRFDFISRKEYDNMVIVDRLVQAKMKEYDGEYVDEWSQEDKAWYSQLMDTYQKGDSFRYVLPRQGDLSEEAAKDIAWEAFITLTGIEGKNRKEYSFTTYLYTQGNSEQRIWAVNIGLIGASKMHLNITSPDGELIPPDEEEVEWFRENLHDSAEDREMQQAFERWEEEKGSIEKWTHEERADFYRQFGGTIPWAIPGEDALAEQKALSISKEHLMEAYQVPQADLDAWVEAALYMAPEGEEPNWEFRFYSEEGGFQTYVKVGAISGQIMESQDPYAPGHG